MLSKDLLAILKQMSEDIDGFETIHPTLHPHLSEWIKEHVKERTTRLLKMIVAPSFCAACGRTIYFVRMKSGKTNPITEEGISHFADCQKAKRFRK